VAQTAGEASWNLDAPKEGNGAMFRGMRSPDEAQALLRHLSPML